MRYYLKNIYYLNYKILMKNFPLLLNLKYKNLIRSKRTYIKILISQTKQRKQSLKHQFKLQINRYLKFKFLLRTNIRINPYKLFRFLYKKKKFKEFKFLPDSLPFLKSLKTARPQILKLDNLINYYGYIYLKSSGINTFVTLTNSKGEVLPLIQRAFLKMLNV